MRFSFGQNTRLVKNFFWKTFGASALASLITGVLLIIILVFMLSAVLGSFLSDFDGGIFGGKDDVSVEEGTVLHLSFSGTPMDSKGYYDAQLGIGQPNLLRWLGAIEAAKNNPKIEGIFIESDISSGGLASLKEIRDALQDFKESGKWIIAYSNTYSQKSYYLASVAHEMYLNPSGYSQVGGLNVQISFIKGMLEKLDIEAQIIRGSNNKFKSAIEPLINDSMSAASELQSQRYVNTMWSVMAEEMASARGQTADIFNAHVDSLPYMSAPKAYEYGMVDGLLFRDEVIDLMKDKVDDMHLLSFKKYAGKYGMPEPFVMNQSIAVIYAEGSIGMDDGSPGSIGLKNLPKAIKAARENPFVKAIVLRVNSGGGAVITSDLILHEIKKAQEEKPVYVSMGNAAASGGYYIACSGEKISASPLTITGSIGVFAVWPNLEGFFEEKLGITFDGVRSNEKSDFGMPTRKLTEAERKQLQSEVDFIYDQFLEHVTSNRSTFSDKAEVDSIGQGRVWSGVDALELGLIDNHAGLVSTIDMAAQEVGLENYQIKEYPEVELSGLDRILALLESAGEESSIEQSDEILFLLEQYNYLKDMNNMKGMQARMLYQISFN